MYAYMYIADEGEGKKINIICIYPAYNIHNIYIYIYIHTTRITPIRVALSVLTISLREDWGLRGDWDVTARAGMKRGFALEALVGLCVCVCVILYLGLHWRHWSVCVCMYVCRYVCLEALVGLCMCVCVYVCRYVCLEALVGLCVCVCMYMPYVQTSAQVYTHTCSQPGNVRHV
jgi:hypothetical protein